MRHADSILYVNESNTPNEMFRLEELGYSPKGIDGRIGQDTRAAINRLFRDRGIPKMFDVNREVIDIVLKL